MPYTLRENYIEIMRGIGWITWEELRLSASTDARLEIDSGRRDSGLKIVPNAKFVLIKPPPPWRFSVSPKQKTSAQKIFSSKICGELKRIENFSVNSSKKPSQPIKTELKIAFFNSTQENDSRWGWLIGGDMGILFGGTSHLKQYPLWASQTIGF